MAVSFTATTVSNPSGAQGSYPQRLVVGHEGMIADLQAYVCRAYRNQSGAAIPFGALVMTDNNPTSNDPLAIELASAATLIQGLAVSTMTMEGILPQGSAYTPNPTPYAADGRLGYADKQTVNVVSKGVVWVWTTEAVAIGDAVRFWKADHSGTVAGAFVGRFAKSAVNNKTVAITAGARWLSETSDAGLALLEIDIPSCTFSADTGA